jgi:hypothetical protein
MIFVPALKGVWVRLMSVAEYVVRDLVAGVYKT